jgi:hypothetical protein
VQGEAVVRLIVPERFLGLPLCRPEQLIEADAMEHLRPNPINTPNPTSAPSWVGSMCTRNGRLPNGASTTLTMASATTLVTKLAK